METRHVVWDWNGTLFDDNHAVLAAVNRVCRHYGSPEITIDRWRETFSRPLLQCYEGLLGRSLSDDDWAFIDVIFHEEYHAFVDACGLAEGVEALRERTSHTQSLLSMYHHDNLVPLITRHGIHDLFTRVDGLRAVGYGSKAEHLVRHLDAQGLDPAAVVLVGDVVDDAEAAEHAGTRVVLVTTGVTDRRRLEATGAPVADSIAGVLRYLDS
ncbi:HAD hydrolase-like protein [Saccharothrix violaceirubra]|nr:HAD hydrolase-like protein [Saccharothrix violaceirubra]